jgi:xanthine dehydrogenase YagT iron-sulfur-binding subunit
MSTNRDTPPGSSVEQQRLESDAQESSAVSPRRRFLKSVGASGVAVASGAMRPTLACDSVQSDARVPLQSGLTEPASFAEQTVQLTVNGVLRRLNVAPNAILLDVLRDELQLTGTKKGCDHGQCGACTIHVNGISINSCLSLAVMHDGDSITTVEGLRTPGKLHPIQQAFWEHDAYQCGYCTAGQMMSAVAILKDARIPADDNSLSEAMSGNICRCGAYRNIVAAIQSTRSKLGRTA